MPPFFTLVVEHGERRGGAGSATCSRPIFSALRRRSRPRRGRGEREVDDAEWNAEAAGMLPGPSWPTRGDLERGALDGFAQEPKSLPLAASMRGDHAGAGDADVDDRVALGHAVEAAGHEIVVRGVAEGHELHAAVGIVVGGGARRCP